MRGKEQQILIYEIPHTCQQSKNFIFNVFLRFFASNTRYDEWKIGICRPKQKWKTRMTNRFQLIFSLKIFWCNQRYCMFSKYSIGHRTGQYIRGMHTLLVSVYCCVIHFYKLHFKMYRQLTLKIKPKWKKKNKNQIKLNQPRLSSRSRENEPKHFFFLYSLNDFNWIKRIFIESIVFRMYFIVLYSICFVAFL